MPSKMAMPTEEFKSEPSICIRMTKEQLKDISIGDSVSADISGTVTGMRQCFDDKTMYDVDLKPFTVKDISVNMEEDSNEEDSTS